MSTFNQTPDNALLREGGFVDDPTKYTFYQALECALRHEGGFVNDPSDPGGATNYGVSFRFLAQVGELDLDQDGRKDGDFDLDGDVDVGDIRSMSPQDAAKIYQLHWWDKYGYEGINAPRIAIKLFDLSINMGARQAHKCLQRALRACGHEGVVDDGVLGPKTFEAINKTSALELNAALRSEAAGFYRALVAAKPPLSKYINGWLNRAYS